MSEWEEYVEGNGFKPMMAGDPPAPKTPKASCAVEGCTRVVYKSVVCRKHWNAIPFKVRMRRAIDAQMAQQTAKIDTDVEIMGLVEGLEA